MTENEMCFPETWEEFRKQYRIVDTEKVYTNGTEMIPTFRVEQWLDHMESVKRSQQSEQNKMAQVAQIFSKNLGEEFVMRLGKDMYRARLDMERGLIYQPIPTYQQENWSTNSAFLRLLLTGKAEIVEE